MKKSVKFIGILSIFLIVILIFLLAFQFNYLNLKMFNKKEPRLITIDDECSALMGRVVHQIKSDDGCKVICNSECEVRGLTFHDSQFLEGENNSCHTCKCYCK